MNILIVANSGIGNTVLMTPLIQAIHERYPEGKIDLLIKSSNFDVIGSWPIVHKIYTYHESFNASDYDIAIAAEPSDRNTRQICRQSPRPVIRSKKNFFIMHEVQANMAMAYSLGFQGGIPPLYINMSENDSELNRFNDKIGIHIGSSNQPVYFKKRWTTEKWIELIKKIGYDQVVLIGGKDDEKHAEEIASGSQCVNVCSRYDIPKTARLVKNFKVLISTDSGPMHIATAAGTPVIALFGPTLIQKNHPWIKNGNGSILMYSNRYCSPCQYSYLFNLCDNNQCMQQIQVDQVLDAVNSMKNTQPHKTRIFIKGKHYLLNDRISQIILISRLRRKFNNFLARYYILRKKIFHKG
ncbi:glycosyltransferase family 9 protein [bacterium]|nr:glycosyltransferase family 9 protein [bacterium]